MKFFVKLPDQVAYDMADLYMALEKTLDELRAHNNDEQGRAVIREALKVKKHIAKTYNIVNNLPQ